MKLKWKIAPLMALTVIAAMLLAACGGGGSSSGSTEAASPETEEPAGEAKGSEGESTPASSEPASGSPLVVYDISDVIPGGEAATEEIRGGAKAGAEYINNHLGGINGHPVELVECEARQEPGATSACASKAIEAGAIAVQGSTTLYGPTASKTIREAEIPSLVIPQTPQDFENTGAWPTGSGAASEYACQGWYFGQKLKPKSLTVLVPELSVSQVIANEIAKNFKEAAPGIEVKTVTYPLSGADVTPAVVSATQDDPDFIAMALPGGPVGLKVLEGLIQQGYPLDQTVNVMAGFDIENIETLGSEAEGLNYSAEFLSAAEESEPHVKVYREAMAEYEPDILAEAGYSLWGFENMMFLYLTSKELKGEITGPALFKYYSEQKSLPGYLGAGQHEPPIPPYKGVRTPECRIWHVEEGKPKDLTGEWYTPPPLKNRG